MSAHNFRDALAVELSCLWQCAQFSRRHLRYFIIFLFLYGPSLLHWKRYRAARVGFCTAQWIDDLLDGDRRSEDEPLEIIEQLVQEMETEHFSRDPLSQLTAALFAELSPDGRSEFIALVRTMQRDRMRVLGGEVWEDSDLDAHHQTTFRLSVNLMLRTAGCTARAEEVPALVEALAWCSVFRDLDDDLRKGLINVPRRAWRTTPEAYETWIHESRARASSAIARAAMEIERLDDERSRRILRVFQSSIARFERRLRPRQITRRVAGVLTS